MTGPSLRDPVQRGGVARRRRRSSRSRRRCPRAGAPEERALDPALAVLAGAVPLARRESSKPRAVMSQARLQLADLPLVLDQPQLRQRRGRSSSSRSSSAATSPSTSGSTRRAARGSWRRLRQRRLEARRRGAPRGRGVGDLLQRRAGGRPTARRTAGRGRTRRSRARSAAGRRAPRSPSSIDQHGVGGLVAGEVGVRGVGAEPVVGVVGAHLEGAGRAAPAARRGTPRPGAARRAAAYGATGCARQVELAVAPALAHEARPGLGYRRVVRLGVEGLLVGALGRNLVLGGHAANCTPCQGLADACR